MVNLDQEEIGYRNPPKQYQWPKGTSGFPSGRRKVSSDFGEVFRRVANRNTSIVENGRRRTMTMFEAVMRAPMAHAMRKDKKSRAYVLGLMEEFGTEIAELPYLLKLDEIYRDYEGKLVVNERQVPRKFYSIIAELERKYPLELKMLVDRLPALIKRKGIEK